jgi:hypothetical protein
MNLSTAASNLLDVKTTKFTFEEPDGDDNSTSINLELDITNNSSEDIEFIYCTSILFDGGGNPIACSTDEDETLISAGDTGSISVNPGWLCADLLGTKEEVTCKVFILGGSAAFVSLGELAVPAEPNAVAGTALNADIGNIILADRSCCFFSAPDEEGNTTLSVNLLSKNLTEDHIFRFSVKASLVGSNGRPIEDSESYEEIPEFATKNIELSFWLDNPKRLDGATIRMEAIAFKTIAQGECDATGVTLETYDY